MLRNKISHPLMVYLTAFLLVTSLALPGAAQETPPQPATPTETWTSSPTSSPTYTTTASPTEQPSATPTATSTATQMPEVTQEVDVEQTAEVTLTEVPSDEPTAEVTPEAEITVTETEMPVIAETATLPQPVPTMEIPPEPPLSVLFADTFDAGLDPAWQVGAGWSLVAEAEGQALQNINTNDSVKLQMEPRPNVAVQLQVAQTVGEFHLHLRQSHVADYTVAVGADGELRLLRADDQVATAAVPVNTGEYTLRASIMGSVIRVAIERLFG